MSNLLENHVADVAVTMMFGLGYYLFKAIKNKKEKLFNSDKKSSNDFEMNLKGKLEGALANWHYAKTLEEYHELIESGNDNEGISDPFLVLNLMNKKGVLPTIETYNSLLLNCLKKGNFEQAEILKEEMLDNTGPVTPNVKTLSVLIKGLEVKYLSSIQNEDSNSNHSSLFSQFDKELMNLIELLESRQVYMDLKAQNNILEALVNMSRLFEAWNHFCSMKKFFSPNLFTYETMLNGIKNMPESNKNDEWLSRVIEIYKEYIENTNNTGVDISNSNNLNTILGLILEICVKFNNLEKAEEIFRNHTTNTNNNKSHSPLENLYIILIKGFGKVFKLDKAYEIFTELKLKLFTLDLSSPSTLTYEAMLNTCVRCKDINLAEDLVAEMTRNKIDKSLSIYITMIHGYRKSRNYSKAIELYEYFMDKYRNKDPSVGHITITTAFFNAILDCLVDGNKYDKMNEIFTFMQENCNSNSNNSDHPGFPQMDLITYSIIMKGYAKGNSINKVTELYSYLRSRKEFQLDEVLYNTIIDCYARHNDEGNVLRVYSDMKESKVKASVVTYGVLMKLYCNLGNCNRAFELFDECLKASHKPSVVLYQMLIKLQIKFKFIDRAIDLFKNMIFNNVKADQQVYELIIKACLDQDRFKSAVDFVVSASTEGVKLDKHVYMNTTNNLMDSSEFRNSSKIEILKKIVKFAENYMDPVLKEKILNFIQTHSQIQLQTQSQVIPIISNRGISQVSYSNIKIPTLLIAVVILIVIVILRITQIIQKRKKSKKTTFMKKNLFTLRQVNTNNNTHSSLLI